jgi:hypothetical protein
MLPSSAQFTVDYLLLGKFQLFEVLNYQSGFVKHCPKIVAIYQLMVTDFVS